MTMLFLKAAPRLRRGTTLIELLIAMLILAIVCISWLQIIGIQSARREARRREAVERLAGMMDAFMAVKTKPTDIKVGTYYLDTAKGLRENDNDVIDNDYCLKFEYEDNFDSRYYVFNEGISPICYQLKVESSNPLLDATQSKTWKIGNKDCYWLVGRLYDKSNDTQPYFTLPICFGFPK